MAAPTTAAYVKKALANPEKPQRLAMAAGFRGAPAADAIVLHGEGTFNP
jgi:hypothetical protein